MKKIVYELNYGYYKYNSGNADNGNYKNTIVYEESRYDEVLSLFNDISSSISKTLTGEKNEKLVDRYIPYGGFFNDVKLTKVVRDEIVVGEDGKMSKNQGYTSIEFSDCDHCYSIEEGYSPGCIHCNDTGQRKLSPEGMALAMSATEWAETKVNDLWKDYNAIFKLNLGFTKWSMYSNTILIEAGYSCRGSYSGESFELPQEWLYANNRKELIQKLYDEKEEKKNKDNKKFQEQKLLRLKEETTALEKQLNGVK